MAATHGEYRTYLRNTGDLETGQQQRFHPGPSSEPTYRSLLFGTLAVMGLLQVASSVAILLHLTGYLREVGPVRLSCPVLNALKDPAKKGKCKPTPSAHLPIKAKADSVLINWDEVHSTVRNMSYQNGKLFVMVSGLYYVYAKTCFRYYNHGDSIQASVDVSNTQLIQYVFHQSIRQNSNKPAVLMKTGSTMRWDNTSYNMYCAQQGRAIYLDKGDAVFVNVSNAWLLDKEAEGTYFGTIWLWEPELMN
uniref:TNF superfamily member 11 n=1 Tax=Nothobranchius furzeri TaxID=105023 RepID=A0A8C6L7T6_NOTFU